MPMVAFGMLLCRSRSDGGTWLAVSNQIGRQLVSIKQLGWTVCPRYHKIQCAARHGLRQSDGRDFSLDAIQSSDTRLQVWP